MENISIDMIKKIALIVELGAKEDAITFNLNYMDKHPDYGNNPQEERRKLNEDFDKIRDQQERLISELKGSDIREVLDLFKSIYVLGYKNGEDAGYYTD